MLLKCDFKKDASQSGGAGCVKENVYSFGAREIEDAIGKIESGKSVHFVTAAQWGMHDLIRYVLLQIGRCEVWMTVYSISEDPARALFLLKDAGYVTGLHGLVDWHVKRDKARAWQSASGCFDEVGFSNVHAKVVVMEGRDVSVCIVSSGNFNRNKRFEAGVLCADKKICDFHREWIKTEIRKNNR